MNLSLEDIRACFEGAIPAQIATCAPDGTPNAAYLSQVHYVDARHVALSFQFFSKTRENVLANPHARIQVIDPETAIHYSLGLRYRRTETDGPVFEYMKARLAGVASQTGMSGIFKLRGADIYEVEDIHCESPAGPDCRRPRLARLPALRACAHALTAAADLPGLLDALLAGLAGHFRIGHAMVLMADHASGHLYTVASLGYDTSGIGSEIPFGSGIIGVAAQERTPIRIGYPTAEYSYSRALRQRGGSLEKEIPFPGLAEPHSQLAVPILHGDRLQGVLYVESETDLRFDYEDEDALATLAAQLAFALQAFEQAQESETRLPGGQAGPARGTALEVRHYQADDSVFIDGEYLIKGVAGAILWKLLNDHERDGRRDFCNRELRLDASLRLPDISDNLEARLTLLQRRLAERCPPIQIEKTGRGRLRLVLDRPARLVAVPA